jgi:hypothetical protein
MNGDVHALAVLGNSLYAGGQFTLAGEVYATNIAQWNGSSWSALGSGLNADVLALAVSGGTLYAAGYFTIAGGVPANYIAQWNGSSWSPLGSGLNADVLALAVSGGTLYAGGDFTTAGTNVSTYLAEALISASQTPGAPTLYIIGSSNSVTVFWQDVPGWSLQQNSNLATPAGWTASSYAITAASDTNSITITPPMGNLFFRLNNP